MGTSSEIAVYSLTSIKQKERLNFLSLVSASKTHLDSREKMSHDATDREY